MKKVLFMFMAATLALPLNAQEENGVSKSTFFDNFVLGAEITAGTKNKGMDPASLSFNIGYQIFPHIYAYAKATGTLGLYKKDDVKTYFQSQALGGGIGFKLYNPKTASQGTDLRLSVTNTIGNADWKYTSYEADVIIYPNYKKIGIIAPYIGLGFSHKNSHTSGLSNWNGLTGTIGIKF